MKCSRILIVTVLALFSGIVLAGGHREPPPTPSGSNNSAKADSYAQSSADSSSRSRSASEARQRQAQSQTSEGGTSKASADGGTASNYSPNSANNETHSSAAGGTGNGSVDVGGDSSDYRALAVSLPGLVAAPAVVSACMLHSRGWGGFSAGATGGTYFDAGCAAKVQCLSIADRYAAWNRVDLALKQVETCGGVAVVDPPAPPVVQQPAVDLTGYATHQEVEQAFRRSVSK